MKIKKKVVLALTLALASLTAQAQNKGMDIGLGPTTQPAPQVSQQPVPAASPAVSQQPNANRPAQNQPVARPTPAAVRQEAPAKELPVPTVTRRVERTVVQPVRVAQPKFTRAISLPAPVVEAQVMAAPVAQRIAAPAAPIAAPRQANIEAETNPFTGKGLSAEYRQRQLEEAKMDTDLIQEKLKQANLIADLTYLPLKKKAEVSTLPGIAAAANSTAAAAAPKPAVSGMTSGAPEGVTDAPPKPAVRKQSKKVKAPKKVEPTPPLQLPVPMAPSITISGISINGSYASAIIETDGGVMSAQNGESTPFGQLRVIDQRTVTLGGKTHLVRDAMLSRMMVSDPVYVDPEKVRNAPQAIVPVAPPANIPLPPLPPLPAPPRNLAASKAPVPGM